MCRGNAGAGTEVRLRSRELKDISLTRSSCGGDSLLSAGTRHSTEGPRAPPTSRWHDENAGGNIRNKACRTVEADYCCVDGYEVALWGEGTGGRRRSDGEVRRSSVRGLQEG